MPDSRPGRRVAVVAGVRTPFAKSGTQLRDVPAVALARHFRSPGRPTERPGRAGGD